MHCSHFCQWKQVLWHQRLLYEHLHISQTQVGILNNRPRYYGVAVLSGKENNIRGDSFHKLFFPKQVESDKESEMLINTKTPYPGKNKISIPPISKFLDNDSRMESPWVPNKAFSSSALWCFDILTLIHNRSSRFTKSYGICFRGTGSVLYMGTQAAGSCTN